MDEILRDGPLDATTPGPGLPGELRGRAERSRGPEELLRFERAQFADVIVRPDEPRGPDEPSESRVVLRARGIGAAEDGAAVDPAFAAELPVPGLPAPVAGEHAGAPVTDPEQPAAPAAEPDGAEPDRADADRAEADGSASDHDAAVDLDAATTARAGDEAVADLPTEIDAASAAAAVAAEADTAEIDEELIDADDDGLPAVPELVTADAVAKVVFVLMLTSRESLSVLRLAQACNTSQRLVEEALQLLPQQLQALGLPVELTRTGDAVKWMSSSESFPYLQRLRGVKKLEKLSPAALETLAVIAYRQPVMRSEIEAVRGVKAGPMLRSLLQHKLVRCTGRAEVPGRPLQYGTTQLFLERFGLASLQDLPSVKEWKNLG